MIKFQKINNIVHFKHMNNIVKFFTFILISLLGTTMLQSQELTVLIEEDVYTVPVPNNGASVMWGYGSSSLVREGNDVFISEFAILPTAKPWNNCHWKLLKRNTGGWQCLFSDRNRTREPSPVVIFPDSREVFVSTNQTVTDPDKQKGPSQPQVVRFRIGNDIGKPETLLPSWNGKPDFTEHSYRSFAADGIKRELILFQNIEYSHAEWSFFDRLGNWSAQGKFEWPWGAEYVTPCPIRICYPTVTLVDRKVFFCGVSDIIEPNPQWFSFKKELTGNEWDYDFQRLFFTWTNNITNEEFQPWVEVSSRKETCGWINPCDLYVAPDESVHILWFERAIDIRLRERFFPGEKQSEALCHAVIHDGKILKRSNVAICHENEIKPIAMSGRLHATPDGRLWVVYYVQGKERNEKTGEIKSVSENRTMEIKNGEPSGKFQTIPLEKPFSKFFTNSVRAGNVPSNILDMHGICPNSNQVRYAAVGVY